jgi:hypothetical protein
VETGKFSGALLPCQAWAHKDAPAALVMGGGFLAFGLTMILRPGKVRGKMDGFADSWKQASWHPYKMPDRGCV